jgi:beta-glucosidase
MMRSAAFDDDLEYRAGRMIARELVANGANFFGGVCINIVRNPRWGRSQESYGEDPFMVGRMGAALTRAIQEEGLIACAKHFALNSIENLRFHVDARADERALREIYLPHFKACVDAGALSVMSAYNRVNGEYCGENRKLLTEILREEWGFEGFVMSDFVYGVHDCAESYAAGMDVEMPWRTHHGKAKKLIREGRMDVARVDRATRRVLRVLLQQTSRIRPVPKSVVKCPAHIEMARELATKGSVLLKNDGVLPISRNARIAVVGPYADTVNVGDHGSSFILNKDGVTPYMGLSRIFQNVGLHNGLEFEPALMAAEAADIVVVCVGFDSRHEGELLTNQIEKLEKDPTKKTGGDRDSLHLGQAEIALIQALKAAGKKVVVSLMTGSVILTRRFEEHADAILLSFYGGVQAGTALADLLVGRANPSGKLPVTIAKNEEDYPPFLEIGQKPYEIDYGYYLGYMLFDKKGIEPEYPFGFGLSYTTFELGAPAVRKTDAGFEVSVPVKNTGKREGAEVVQVYVGSMGAPYDRPVRQLKGYRRIELEPGEVRDFAIEIAAKDLRFYHPESKTWELDAGYRVFVGTDSRRVMTIPGDIAFP